MQLRLPVLFALLTIVQVADAKPTVRRLQGLIVMTPSPTQAPPPGLRLRTMVRPADRLWIGVDVPPHVPLEVGELKLDLLDPKPGGGFIATYRERFEPCYARGEHANCKSLVKIFDDRNVETASLSLDAHLSRPEHLEVQDVRFVDDRLYFNEACQSYSIQANGKCSSLVALDPFTNKVLWRTAPLVSNNAFLSIGQYIVAAYGFAGEPASVRVIRRSDGKIIERHPLASTNFEMTTNADVLSIDMYNAVGRANFRFTGFDGDAPKLKALPTTPPNPLDKPKPYDPPLIK
jgi:hypothetical protein